MNSNLVKRKKELSMRRKGIDLNGKNRHTIPRKKQNYILTVLASRCKNCEPMRFPSTSTTATDKRHQILQYAMIPVEVSLYNRYCATMDVVSIPIRR